MFQGVSVLKLIYIFYVLKHMAGISVMPFMGVQVSNASESAPKNVKKVSLEKMQMLPRIH